MADSKKYNGSTWEHSLRKLTTATDTITTLPADIYADGNNATIGISGNTVQSGTPTPQNPIQPQGTGDKTENLLPDIRSVNGWVVGYIEGDGTYTPVNANGEWLSPKIAMTSGETITISAMPILGSSMSFYSWNGTTFLGGVTSTKYSGSMFTTPANTTHIQLALRAGGDKKTEADIISSGFWVMMNSGSTAKPYEPYGYKIPLSSASTTTNVYLGEVETTRRIKKLVLTGEEEWVRYASIADCYRLSIANAQGVTRQGICSHYAIVDITSQLVDGTFVSGQNYSYFKDVTAQNLDGWKSYLAAQYAAGTPVTVWYVLATETTGIVNEPLMKIGDYADEVSGITIPVTAGGDSFDVLTTLKPSEVSLSYTGWHDATVKERDGSRWV